MWQVVRNIARTLLIFVCGGWAVLVYLKFHLEPSVPEIDRLESFACPAAIAAMLVWSQVRQKLGQKPSPVTQPSPAWSGSAVVIATGVAAAYSLGKDFDQPSDLILPALTLAATGIIAALVFRFGRRNADQIGEARFRSGSTN